MTHAHKAIKAPDTCPECTNQLGARHGRNCRILAEVITDPARPLDAGTTPRTTIVEWDIRTAGCGCPAVLVDSLGTQHGGHRNCLRETWITAVTKPTTVFQETHTTDPGIDHPHARWTAAWTDLTVSRHGIHNPTHATAYQSLTGFDTWDDAAKFLDDLALRARPLGVFLAASRAAASD